MLEKRGDRIVVVVTRVLDRDDEDERPDHQRDDAHHVIARDDASARDVDVVDGLSEGVERAGADIAEDDADGRQRKRPESASSGGVSRR